MSLTRVVPAEVPFDVHSSRPWLPSLALKNVTPLTLVREFGLELGGPGRMSSTRKVGVELSISLRSSCSRRGRAGARRSTLLRPADSRRASFLPSSQRDHVCDMVEPSPAHTE